MLKKNRLKKLEELALIYFAIAAQSSNFFAAFIML